MADPFVAEIRMFGFNFAPRGWALCNGQLLPLSQNTALFSLLGTYYGGNGQSTFALPNLQGSVPMFWGQGPGLSLYDLGQSGGSEAETLISSEIPIHQHAMMAATTPANVNTPSPQVGLARSSGGFAYQSNVSTNIVQMSPSTLTPAGSDLPHNNDQPYLAVNFCIALQGLYPPHQRPTGKKP
jgi:microcystin-dependent protein